MSKHAKLKLGGLALEFPVGGGLILGSFFCLEGLYSIGTGVVSVSGKLAISPSYREDIFLLP